jgi:hypothetical protein
MQSGKTYSGLDVDYNIYYRSSGTTYWKYGATNYSFSNWKTNSGQDAHSVNEDPLFVSSSDFHLQAASPCINAGTDVGLTTDYAGNSIVGNHDIGAYEYIPPIGEQLTNRAPALLLRPSSTPTAVSNFLVLGSGPGLGIGGGFGAGMGGLFPSVTPIGSRGFISPIFYLRFLGTP